MSATYRIVTLGCKLNQADAALLEGRLLAIGMARAPGDGHGAGEGIDPAGNGGAAAVVILNTCTVTHRADREARQIARRLRRSHPRAVLIATGCFAERDAAALARVGEIDHVVGLRAALATIPALAAAACGLSYDPGAPPLSIHGATAGCDPIADRADHTRAFLKIQDGCNLRCAYCIIPSVRGQSRSVAPEAVVGRLRRLIEAGFREIVLTGVNSGDYGRDLAPPTSLADLLRRMAALPGTFRLRLNSLEPRTVTGDVVRALAESGGSIAPHLQIPLQSGSDRILALMRRPYRARHYRAVVESLRRRLPAIGLGADVIVGHPGETEEDFRSTCDLIASSPLNYLHVFSYSPRPGTPAAGMAGQVSDGEIRERSARLRLLGDRLSVRFRNGFLGRRLPVLVLRGTRPDGRSRALSDNFIHLGLDRCGRDAASMENSLISARVTGVTPDDTLAVPA